MGRLINIWLVIIQDKFLAQIMDLIPKPNNLKVIGSGIGKTGTLSLRMALLEIGFRPCYHGYELLKADFIDDNNLEISGFSNMDDASKWVEAMMLKDQGEILKCCKILEGLLTNYVATVDWPAS